MSAQMTLEHGPFTALIVYHDQLIARNTRDKERAARELTAQ